MMRWPRLARDEAGLPSVECRQLARSWKRLKESLRLRRALGDGQGTAELLTTLTSTTVLGGD